MTGWKNRTKSFLIAVAVLVPTSRSVAQDPPGGPPTRPPDSKGGGPIVLVAQDNLWFRSSGDNYLIDGKTILPFEPRQGRTSSSDPLAKMQELQWLFRYTSQTGDAAILSQEWIAPSDLIDKNLRRTFLPLIELTEARWNLFYDPVQASIWRGFGEPGPVDFSRPEIFEMWRKDLEYFERQYFNHPNYWKIRGKPVLHVWAVRQLIENADQAFEMARKRGIYICGDTFGQKGPEPPIDCRTGFTAATPDIVGSGRFRTAQQVLSNFERYFLDDDDKDLIPAFSFQYDDEEFRTRLGLGGSSIQILAESRTDVRNWLNLATRHAKPIDGTRYIWVGTLNNWAEATSIYPTAGGEREFWGPGLRRRAQPYGYAILEEIERKLYPKPRYRGPKIKVRKNGTIVFKDCDVKAQVTIKIHGDQVTNDPDWKTWRGFTMLPGFDRKWKPQGEFESIEISVLNLDGRSAEAVARPRR